MADIVFHPEARDEYEEVIAWYRERSRLAAARFEAAVDRMLALIGETPDLFRQYDDLHRIAVLQRFPYSLVYRVRPGRIIVVAVAHAKRPPVTS